MRTIAIGSGKGGVGKSSLTANLAMILAKQGHRVVAMDADFGLANLDVMLGLPSGPTLHDVIQGRATIEEIVRTHPSGVRVLPGCRGVAEMADLDASALERLLDGLRALESTTDVMLIDLAAGVHEAAIATLAAADIALIVMNGDPSSFVDAYATIKMLAVRNPVLSIRVVANEVSDTSQGKLLFARMQAVARENLEISVGYAGSVRRDNALANAVLKRDVVVEHAPHSAASIDLYDLADTIMPGGLHVERSASSFFSRLFSWSARPQRAA